MWQAPFYEFIILTSFILLTSGQYCHYPYFIERKQVIERLKDLLRVTLLLINEVQS